MNHAAPKKEGATSSGPAFICEFFLSRIEPLKHTISGSRNIVFKTMFLFITACPIGRYLFLFVNIILVEGGGGGGTTREARYKLIKM